MPRYDRQHGHIQMLFVNLKYFELYVTKIRQQIEQFLKGLGDSKCFCSYWHRRTSRSNVCLHEYLVQPNARLGYNFVRTMKKCWLCPKKKKVDYALNMDYQPTIEGQRQFWLMWRMVPHLLCPSLDQSVVAGASLFAPMLPPPASSLR